MRSELERLVAHHGLDEVVRLPGWSDHPADLVSGASVHVVPSRADAWSQSAVLALALGVPVVATAVEGLPTTLGQRRGLLVAPGDPGALAVGIIGLLDGRVRTDVAGGRRYAARFSVAEVAADYLAHYDRLVTAARPRPVVGVH
jgi:glycosyltransferase involved in cell wall biosynthesis